MNRFAPFLLALLLVSGCSSTDKTDSPPEQVLPGFESAEVILSTAEALLTDLEIDEVTRLKLKQQTEALLKHADLKRALVDERINAIGAYHTSGGGLILGVKTGGGLVEFADGTGRKTIDAKSFVLGAVAGGASTKGVFLAVGIRGDHRNLQGQYSFTAVGGAIAETSAGSIKATPKEGSHVVYATATSVGVMGEAGAGSTSIMFVKPKPADDKDK